MPILRNESTPEGREMWAAVDNAARQARICMVRGLDRRMELFGRIECTCNVCELKKELEYYRNNCTCLEKHE